MANQYEIAELLKLIRQAAQEGAYHGTLAALQQARPAQPQPAPVPSAPRPPRPNLDLLLTRAQQGSAPARQELVNAIWADLDVQGRGLFKQAIAAKQQGIDPLSILRGQLGPQYDQMIGEILTRPQIHPEAHIAGPLPAPPVDEPPPQIE